MLEQLKIELDQLLAHGQLREFAATNLRGPGIINIRGKRLADLTNWDFLAVNSDPRLSRAAHLAIEDTGIGASSARLVAGTTKFHLSCERRLAQFFATGGALLFSSKNQAVMSLITALSGEGDVVFIDELLQSPVADAAFLMNSQVVTFSVGDVEKLDGELAKFAHARRRFVVVESLSPLTGREAALGKLSAIVARHDAYLVADESYALGAIGLRGAGGAEILGPQVGTLIRFGSLAHGIGCYGAFIAGPQIVEQYLIQRSKTFLTEISLPPGLASAIETGVDIVELSPIARERIGALAKKLRGGLRGMGFLQVDDTASPVVCLPVNKLSTAYELNRGLFQRGFFAEVLQQGKALSDGGIVRMLMNINHTENAIDDLLQSFADLKMASKVL